jgi:deoxyribodipyrimidine photo-lyase
MNNTIFEPKTKAQLLEYVSTIDPKNYERTRNSLNGSVTMLSPYITAGVISLTEIKDKILSQNSIQISFKLIQELAWRDYFQSVLRSLGDETFKSIKREQEFAQYVEMPTAVLEAKTGIEVIDKAVTKLYEIGYLHNHERMWLAMLVCNVAGTKWEVGAKWMYYHLIDGDLASNTLSWQWVAGTFSSKKYFANQENLNKYGNSQNKQLGTVLDKSYEELSQNSDDKIAPTVFEDRTELRLENNTEYLASFFEKADQSDDQSSYFTITTINESLLTKPNPVLVFVEDKDWLISKQRIDFVVSQIKLIAPNIKLLIVQKDSPDYDNIIDKLPKQERMFPTLTDYYQSFFKFWSKAERLVK